MAQITINTDELIARAIGLEREKLAVLEDIAVHRDDMRRIARQIKDKEFQRFVANFYAEKKRGETKDPKVVKEAQKWKRQLVTGSTAESNGN